MGLRRFLYLLPAMAWLVLILVLSFLPGKSFPSITLLEWDKLAHLVLYGVWMSLIRFALAGSERRLKRWLFVAFLFTTATGVLIEFGQEYFTRDREFDVYDIVANTAGSFLALVLLVFRRK